MGKTSPVRIRVRENPARTATPGKPKKNLKKRKGKGRRIRTRRILQKSSGVPEVGDLGLTVTITMKYNDEVSYAGDEDDNEDTMSGQDEVSNTKRKRPATKKEDSP